MVRQVKAVLAHSHLRLALDPVGGTMSQRLAECLSDGGHIVNYGMLSGDPCQIHPEQVIFRGISLSGFGFPKLSTMTQHERTAMFDKLSQWMLKGVMHFELIKCFPWKTFPQQFGARNSQADVERCWCFPMAMSANGILSAQIKRHRPSAAPRDPSLKSSIMSLVFPFDMPPAADAPSKLHPACGGDAYHYKHSLTMSTSTFSPVDEGWTLVDTGNNTTESQQALSVLLQTNPFAQLPVVRVIATHHHPDHIGQVGQIAMRGAEFFSTRTTWLYGRVLQLDVQSHPTRANSIRTTGRTSRH